MNPPQTSARLKSGDKKKRSTFQVLSSARLAGKATRNIARLGAIFVVFAMVASAFYSSSAASSFHIFSRVSQAGTDSSNPQATIKSVGDSKSIITNKEALFVKQGGPLAASFPALEQYLPLAALAQAAPGPETVTLYAGPGCTVPKTDFELGDVACAKVT